MLGFCVGLWSPGHFSLVNGVCSFDLIFHVGVVNLNYKISSVMLMEDRRMDDVIIKIFLNSLLYKINRFQVAVRLFSNRSQMTSKCGLEA